MIGTPFGTPTERRSTARRNASQTRPDQTRVFWLLSLVVVSGLDQIQSDRHLGPLAAPIGFGDGR